MWDPGKGVLTEVEVVSFLRHCYVLVWHLQVWQPRIWPDDKAHMTRTVERKDDHFIMPLSYTTLDQLWLPLSCGEEKLHYSLLPLATKPLVKSQAHLSVLLLTRIYRTFDMFTDVFPFLKYVVAVKVESLFLFSSCITDASRSPSVLITKIWGFSGLRLWASFLFFYTSFIVDLLFPWLLISPITWLPPHVHLCYRPAVYISDCLTEIVPWIFHRSLMLKEAKID